MSIRSHRTRAALALLFFSALSMSANAGPFFWTDCQGTDLDPDAGFRDQGTITAPTASVGVTCANPRGAGFYQPRGGTDYDTGGAGTQTQQFAQAITDPDFALVRLNGNGYAFNQDFEILSWGGGSTGGSTVTETRTLALLGFGLLGLGWVTRRMR